MIAIDTSSLVHYLSGADGEDTRLVDRVLEAGHGILPPPVVTEVLSDPKLPQRLRDLILQLPELEITPGFWIRAATTRSKLLSSGFRARLGDALIAQFCIDHNVGLITRDIDFRHYELMCGLRIIRKDLSSL